MKLIWIIASSFFFLSVPTWGQSGGSQNYASGLALSFVAEGRQTGRVLNLDVANHTNAARTLTLPGLVILTPADPRYSTVLLESSGTWNLKPGAHLKLSLSGYSLQKSKAVPSKGTAVGYTISEGDESQQTARYVLQEGLKLERTAKFEATFLPAKKHRLLVHQRSLWRATAGGNPTKPQQLASDIKLAFKSRGKPVSDKVAEAITASVWRDVEKVFKRVSGS